MRTHEKILDAPAPPSAAFRRVPLAAAVLAATAVMSPVAPAAVYASRPLGHAVLAEDRRITLLEVTPEIRVLWTFEAPFKPIQADVSSDGSRVVLVNGPGSAGGEPGDTALLVLDRRGRPITSVSFEALFAADPSGKKHPIGWIGSASLDEAAEVLGVRIFFPDRDWKACMDKLTPCLDTTNALELELDCDTGEPRPGDGGAGEDDDESD